MNLRVFSAECVSSPSRCSRSSFAMAERTCSAVTFGSLLRRSFAKSNHRARSEPLGQRSPSKTSRKASSMQRAMRSSLSGPREEGRISLSDAACCMAGATAEARVA